MQTTFFSFFFSKNTTDRVAKFKRESSLVRSIRSSAGDTNTSKTHSFEHRRQFSRRHHTENRSVIQTQKCHQNKTQCGASKGFLSSPLLCLIFRHFQNLKLTMSENEPLQVTESDPFQMQQSVWCQFCVWIYDLLCSEDYFSKNAKQRFPQFA